MGGLDIYLNIGAVITSISRSPIEYEFTVSPHWFVNEDWEKAGQLAQQYIDENYGDAPTI